MAIVRVRVEDSELDALLDSLKGKEVLVSEGEDPTELVLFYISRMNSKLDNLGQLKHVKSMADNFDVLAKRLIWVVGLLYDKGYLKRTDEETLEWIEKQNIGGKQ